MENVCKVCGKEEHRTGACTEEKNKSPEQMAQEEGDEAKLIAFGINERATKSTNQKVRERALMFVEKLTGKDADVELRNLRLIENDFQELIDGDPSSRDLKRDLYYKGWSVGEIKELFGILYGEESEEAEPVAEKKRKPSREKETADSESSETESPEELWKNKEYGKLFEKLVGKMGPDIYSGNYSEYSGSYSDYDYSAYRVASSLELDGLISDNEELKKMEQQFGSEHYLVDGKKREIIMEFLLPLLEKLPAINKDGEIEEAGRGGISLDLKKMDKYEIRSTVGQLMWTGLCTTKGRGYKLINVPRGLFEKTTGSKSADAIGDVVGKIRGEELKKIIEAMMEEDKIDRARTAKKQGIDFSPGWTKEDIEKVLSAVGEDDVSIKRKGQEEQERKKAAEEEYLQREVESLQAERKQSRKTYTERVDELRESASYSETSREILKRLGEKEKPGLFRKLREKVRL